MESASGSEATGVPDGEVSSNVGLGRGWFLGDGVQTPKVGVSFAPKFCSTRLQVPPCDIQTPQTAANAELSTLISDLANQIGQSIVAQLQGDKGTSMPTETSKAEQGPPELNLSGVKLVLQSDVKEPPVFRGDGSDKFSIHEWVEMMEMYFVKRNTPTDQRSRDILARLMGKAKDVVRVTLRHNPSLDHVQVPELIFDILKQHFSVLTYSSMPMADFYNTKPLQHEGVMEYWIRLNNAIDVADECLRRQGRNVEDPGREVSMMFIKYCPDPILLNRLSIKAAEEWTTTEVQERIDSFQRELRARSQGSFHTSQRREVSHNCSIVPQEAMASQPVQASVALQSQPTAPASNLACQLSPTAACFTPVLADVSTTCPSGTSVSSCPVPTPTPQFQQSPTYPVTTQSSQQSVGCELGSTNTQAFDVTGMRALISLLDRVIACQNVQTAAPASAPSQRFTRGPFLKKSCQVCGNTGHSTHMHCRRENLCLACFAPGHWKKDCHSRREGREAGAVARQSWPSEN